MHWDRVRVVTFVSCVFATIKTGAGALEVEGKGLQGGVAHGKNSGAEAGPAWCPPLAERSG